MWLIALLAASLGNPAGEGSGPVFLAASPEGIAYLSWVEKTPGGHELRFAERTAGGWSAPRRIAGGGNWFVNWADFPSLLAMRGGAMAAHWLERDGADQYAYNLRLAFSADRGATWKVILAPKPAARNAYTGFVSLAETPEGFAMSYLAPVETAGGGHQTSLRYAAFDRKGARQSDEVVDPDVCSCCQTSLGWTEQGPVIAYRDHEAGEIRDTAIARKVGGRWVRGAVHADQWRINACPVNGPSLVARGSRVAVAWYSGKEKNAYLSWSSDGGARFSPPRRLNEKPAEGRVQVAADGENTVVTWLEGAGDGGAELRYRRVDAAGRPGESKAVVRMPAGRSSGFPRVVAVRGGLLFGWKDGRVRTLEVE